MTHITLQNPAAPKNAGIIKFTMLLGGVVFLLMMVFGLIMRAAQGGLIDLDPTLFYQLLDSLVREWLGLLRCLVRQFVVLRLAPHQFAHGYLYPVFGAVFIGWCSDCEYSCKRHQWGNYPINLKHWVGNMRLSPKYDFGTTQNI